MRGHLRGIAIRGGHGFIFEEGDLGVQLVLSFPCCSEVPKSSLSEGADRRAGEASAAAADTTCPQRTCAGLWTLMTGHRTLAATAISAAAASSP
jgi:hypothetical protein